MVYALIHFAVAAALAGSLRHMAKHGFILDEDGDQVAAGTLSFNISMFVQVGVAVYCVVTGARALLCI